MAAILAEMSFPGPSYTFCGAGIFVEEVLEVVTAESALASAVDLDPDEAARLDRSAPGGGLLLSCFSRFPPKCAAIAAANAALDGMGPSPTMLLRAVCETGKPVLAEDPAGLLLFDLAAEGVVAAESDGRKGEDDEVRWIGGSDAPVGPRAG
jgi:hypothetical protein